MVFYSEGFAFRFIVHNAIIFLVFLLPYSAAIAGANVGEAGDHVAALLFSKYLLRDATNLAFCSSVLLIPILQVLIICA